jgi:hypothetical protein
LGGAVADAAKRFCTIRVPRRRDLPLHRPFKGAIPATNLPGCGECRIYRL